MNFPIKVGNETDVENYAKTLVKGEEQLLITRNGKQFLTDGKGGCITINTGTGGSSGTGNASIDDTKKSTTTTYSSEKIESIIGDINDDTLDTLLKGKTLQEQIKQVFLSSNNMKKPLASVIGLPSVETDSVSKMASDVQNMKNNLALYLRNKGIAGATSTDTLSILVESVRNIIQNPQMKNTKLNIVAPTTKQIELNNTINLDSICTSVLEYTPGTQGVVKYDCTFDNSDSVNFVNNPNIVYDGTMKLKPVDIQEDMTFVRDVDTKKEWTYHMNKSSYYSLYHTLDNISIEDGSDSIPEIRLQGTNFPTLTYGKDDINLFGIAEISKITWNTNATNTSKTGLLISFDSGLTWNSYNGTTWEAIDIKNLTEVKNKAMNKTVVDKLTNVQFEELRKNSTKLRFAYYLEQNNFNDVANNNEITVTVNMMGTNKIADNSKFNYKLENDMKTITYTFNTSGTYTINWIGN